MIIFFNVHAISLKRIPHLQGTKADCQTHTNSKIPEKFVKNVFLTNSRPVDGRPLWTTRLRLALTISQKSLNPPGQQLLIILSEFPFWRAFLTKLFTSVNKTVLIYLYLKCCFYCYLPRKSRSKHICILNSPSKLLYSFKTATVMYKKITSGKN